MNELSDAMSAGYTALTLSSPPGSKSGWRKQARLTSWYKKVYRPTESEPHELLLQFREVTKRIFKRDRYQCQGCFLTRYKLARTRGYLTCHHINPRSEGGSLLDDNLLTLCNQCHDYVEEKNYRTPGEIRGCKAPDHRHYDVNMAPDLDWHKWVYGGYRKPPKGV